MVAELRLSVLPEQTGLLLDAAIMVVGGGLTATATVPAFPVQPFAVAVTEYVPPSAVETLFTTGFCADDVKPLGPLQL